MKKFQEYIEKDIHEGIMSTVKGAAIDVAQRLKNLLSRKGGWLFHVLDLQKKGRLPKGITVHRFAGPEVPPQDYLNDPVEKNAQQAQPSAQLPPKPIPASPIISNSTSNESNLNEEQVTLDHPSPRVPNIDAAKLKSILTDHFHNKKPIFVWGAPGIGKTDIVRQVGKEMGVDVIIFNLSMRDPVDYLGLPSVERTSPEMREKTGLFGRTTYNPPKVWPLDNGPEEKGGILFFDEMNRANPSVLNSSLQMVLDRQSGEYKLPSKWVIFAAGNRKSEAPDVTDLGSALSNRFAHYNYTPKFKDFEKWASTTKTEKGEGVVDPRILGFLSFKSDYFHHFDTEYLGSDPMPWPSPRSWSVATSIMNEKKSRMGRELTEEEIEDIIAGNVGQDVAKEFMEYLDLIKDFRIEDLNKVITNPDRVPLPPVENAPKTDAILTAIVYNFNGKRLTADNFANIVKYAIRMESPEYGQKFITTFAQKHPYLREMPDALEHLRDFEMHRGEQLGHQVGEETKRRAEEKKNKK